MKPVRVFWATLVLALLAAATVPAFAGRTCETRLPTPETVDRAMGLAQRTAQALEASGAQVVVLARAGQDLRKYQLRWSHLGLAYREGGRWYVVHKLNDCGRDTAELYRQGLGEFFLDDMFEYRAGFVVPEAPLQQRLLDLLRDNGRAAALHEPRYSLVAYPWAQRYQQSNQWALETLALARAEETLRPSVPPGLASPPSRQRAQWALQTWGYEPTALRIGALERLGGRLTAANVAFDDHPNDKRFSDRIETVTVESVFAWMARSGMSGPMQTVR